MDVVELIQTYKKRADPFQLALGMYIMAIGEASFGADGCGLQLLSAKVADLTDDPDRFAMWLCEVVDARLELSRTDIQEAPPVIDRGAWSREV